jgi:hypothetical protein
VSEGRGRRWFAESLLIIGSILVAFQVEEWRERRAEQRDLDAAMASLREEVEENIATCAGSIASMRENLVAVYHVYRSLEAGALVDGDAALFRTGFSVYDVLPSIGLLTTVAEEMMATGLLREVDDAELRRSISRFPALDRQVRDMLVYWREINAELQRSVVTAVDFRYDPELEDPTQLPPLSGVLEAETELVYDLEALSGNRALKNGFFEAVDIHSDTLGITQRICGEVERTAALLAAAGY